MDASIEIEILKELDGKPIWIIEIYDGIESSGYWALIFMVTKDGIKVATKESEDEAFLFKDYGETWVAYKNEVALEGNSIWHSAKQNPPKKDGMYFGKKDESRSMWLCQYKNGKWTLNAYPEQEMEIVLWAEYTDFCCVNRD